MGLDAQGSSITQGCEREMRELEEIILLMPLIQAQICCSDLKTNFKMLLFWCLHSSLFSQVLCSAAQEEDWPAFTSVGGVWEQVGG